MKNLELTEEEAVLLIQAINYRESEFGLSVSEIVLYKKIVDLFGMDIFEDIRIW